MIQSRIQTGIQTGAEYHWKTRYDRHHMAGHFLDWKTQPNPFKKYTEIQKISLSTDFRFPEISLWDLTQPPDRLPVPKALNKNRIAQILYLAGGITAKSRQAGKEFCFRSVASAGALYPTEIYVGVFNANGLEPGIYHFRADDFVLTPLRNGHFSRFLNDTCRASSGDRLPAVSFFLTGIFFRSAWKYRARAFRYVLLDTGHLLENLILALSSEGLGFTCHTDFNDEKMGRLIGLDDRREAGLVCVNILGNPGSGAQDTPAVDPLPTNITGAGQVSPSEKVYEKILEAYQAGISPPITSEQPRSKMINSIGVTPTSWMPIESTKGSDQAPPFAQLIMHRRSKRNYINQSLSKRRFMRCSIFYADLPRNLTRKMTRKMTWEMIG